MRDQKKEEKLTDRMTDAKLTSISIAIDKAFTAAGHVCSPHSMPEKTD